jgi:hypothetical protein
MILRVPGTAGKKDSRAKGGNECAERAKRQVLHKAGMRPFTTVCWWENRQNSEEFLRKSSVTLQQIRTTLAWCTRWWISMNS